MLNLSVERLLCVLRVTPLPPLLAEVLLLPQHFCFACEETESQRTQLVQTELKIFFYFMVAPVLRCSVPAFSSCSEQRLLFIVTKMLVVVASRVAWNTGSGAHGLP